MYKIFAAILLLIISINAQDNNTFDHSIFDKLLKKHVSNNGMVDYEKFIYNVEFEKYLASISKADLKNFSSEEKLAFFINGYNASVIKNVIDHWPISSPMDVDGFFKKFKFTIAGTELSLDEIEHKRAALYAPVMMHFGLVCAAQSCPQLVQFAYTGENVFQQLEKNAKTFLSEESKNKLDKEKKVLCLSEIFNWFRSTFENKYGSLQNTVLKFASDEDKEFLKMNDVEIVFNKYNWDLNKQ